MRLKAIVLLAALSVPALLFAQDRNTATEAPDTVVTVNADVITQADLDRVRSARADTALGTVLVDLVNERLVLQRGKSLGYSVSDEQYQLILEDLESQNNITSEAQLSAALRRRNLTPEQLRTNVERSVIVSRVLQAEAMAVADEDAQRYFDAHLDDFPLQTFDLAKPAVLEQMKRDPAMRTVLVTQYLQSLHRGAVIVWAQPDLQRAYEQAAR
jgi:parvulin-like peptidyl-prolyl isomerase